AGTDFLRVYRDVGRPRIVVIANRSLSGELLSVKDAAAVGGAVESAPKSGEIDSSSATKFDIPRYEAHLSNCVANDAQRTTVASGSARESVSETQAKDLEAGKVDVLSDLADKVNADILVQVQARPQRISGDVRVTAVAIDIRRREALTRESIDV